MSDYSQGAGWWQASDGKWYPPEQATGWWQASDGKWYPPNQHPTAGPPVASARGPQYAYPVMQVQQPSRNGCLIALAIAGVIAIVGVIGLVALGVFAVSELDNTNVAGKDNGVEMTLEEFDRIENGMTLVQVERIVGGEGALTSSAGEGEFRSEIYSWDGSGTPGANANVSFSGGKVIGKAQFGLQ